jgi:hypothetical protein
MYAYCGDVDAFERSRYFGPSSDIYAVDHFHAAFSQNLPGFTDLKTYDIKTSRSLPDGRIEVEVTIVGQHARPEDARDWVFIMRKATIGVKKGCWVTHRILAADSKWRGVV